MVFEQDLGPFMRRIAFLTGILFFAAQPSIAQDKTTLVLDASGSMWGQVDGVAKITIAQQVVTDLMKTVPDEQEIGLSAYGHNRKGDCSDIETLVEPGLGTRDAIISAVNALKPKGKTPLSEAVRRAAEGLRYQEDKATIILISDGLETCSVDPCAVARTLEETGVDFTAHVIGFDLSQPEEAAQLSCIAQETGGQYLTAETAEDLGAALSKVAQVEPIEKVSKAALPEIVISAQEQADIGAFIDVTWEGADLSQGGFEIVVQTLEGRKINGTVTSEARTAQLEMPVSAGVYEIAMIKIAQQELIATRQIKVNDVSVSLEVPEQVFAGERFDVVWQGPGYRTDRIGIGLEGQRPKSVMLGNDASSPSTLQAPKVPGEYVVIYALSQDQHVLASRPITVLPAPDPVEEAFLECVKDVARKHPDPAVQLFAQAPGPTDTAPNLTEAEAFNLAHFLRSLSGICGGP